MHYLVVDDDETLCAVLERALKRREFQVSVAHNIDTALEHCKGQNIDRAIVDLKLANESGLELIRLLKRENANLEIVMLTGYSSIATAVEAVKQGAIHYLCKPANTEEILAAFEPNNTEAKIPQSPPLS